MRSRQLESALSEFMNEAADHLRAEVSAGAEVPLALAQRSFCAARMRAMPAALIFRFPCLA